MSLPAAEAQTSLRRGIKPDFANKRKKLHISGLFTRPSYALNLTHNFIEKIDFEPFLR
jgi:hypothetical protein